MAGNQRRVRVGIGGWTFEPWRGSFYPEALAHKKELEFASRHLTSIEINATYHGTQKQASFERWHAETPSDFIFSVKGPRFTTNRRVLAEAQSSIEHFFASGVLALKEKLGPINWQFMPTKKCDLDDFEAFLKLLPQSVEGQVIRHAVEVRHPSFRTAEFIALLRAHGVAVVLTDKETFPQIADITAPFVYARLQCAAEEVELGYPPADLDRWAGRAERWAEGRAPDDLGCVASPAEVPADRRDVFIYFINGFKPKAPMAAMALIERLDRSDIAPP